MQIFATLHILYASRVQTMRDIEQETAYRFNQPMAKGGKTQIVKENINNKMKQQQNQDQTLQRKAPKTPKQRPSAQPQTRSPVRLNQRTQAAPYTAQPIKQTLINHRATLVLEGLCTHTHTRIAWQTLRCGTARIDFNRFIDPLFMHKAHRLVLGVSHTPATRLCSDRIACWREQNYQF